MAVPAQRYVLALSPLVEKIFKKLKRSQPDLLEAGASAALKVLSNPLLGKPLRNVFRNCRRVHVAGSHVLVYELNGRELRLLDFDHHDKIYKKYSI